MSESTLTLALVLLLATAFSTPTAALKILGLFPHPAISHFRFFEPVLRGLAEAGHDVTVVGLFPLKDAPENYHDIIIPGEVLTNAFDLQVRQCKLSTSVWCKHDRGGFGHRLALF